MIYNLFGPLFSRHLRSMIVSSALLQLIQLLLFSFVINKYRADNEEPQMTAKLIL